MVFFNIRTSRFLNLFAFLAIIAINVLGIVLPLGGVYIGQDRPSALLPDPIAFFMWGLVYFMMLLFIIYQLIPSTYQLAYINYGITPFFTFHALCNGGWIIAQAYAPKSKPWIQLIIMYTLLISVATMYTRVYSIARKDLVNKEGSDDKFYLNYLFGRLWLSFYLAWAVCTSSFDLFHLIYEGSPETYSNAALMFGGIGFLTLIVLNVTRDSAFGLTIIWSGIWLAVACIDRIGGFSPSDDPLLLCSVAVTGAVALGTLFTLALNVVFCVNRFRFLREENMKMRKPVGFSDVA
ncbi:hypothetical protein DSO57_1030987 [Entomophthora muscae]|uniref:Uncharacterized protein n=1 Tax=Entomophthora muscae TaxID=34485 RepID=A0ACC2SDE2_9FUNG|nr:hypothetical protein DSO57_1030987 [Entomophthora muscae]